MNQSIKLRSGFVTILGRPNAGKSTLLNTLVGSKVAIVADQPQTTRTALSGVVTIDSRHRFAREILRKLPENDTFKKEEPLAQVIFLDTPGIHESKTRMDQQMMREVKTALSERDLLLMVADATVPFGRLDETALEWVRQANTPAFLVLNKVDRVQRLKLLPILERYSHLHDFREIIPISALTGDNLEVLMEQIVAHLPEGPLYFPPDQITEQPMRFLAGEIVREKIIQHTRQELPYANTVLVTQYEETDGLIRIATDIYVEREGQKAIVIGAGGKFLKLVGTEARKELEELLGKKIFLEMHVRVRAEWREDAHFLGELDWRRMVGH
jgi:GTP-binding protein Era